MAPLEWVLIFPIFLAVLCCALWVAGMMIRKSEVTIIVRKKADELRYADQAKAVSTPFLFTTPNEGRVSVSETISFHFSGIMPEGMPSARHTLLLNSWDHQQVSSDRVPDFSLAVRLAQQGPESYLNTKLNGIINLLSDLSALTDSLEGLLTMDDPLTFFSDFISATKSLQSALKGFSSSNQHGTLIGEQRKNEITQIAERQVNELLTSGSSGLAEVFEAYKVIANAESSAESGAKKASAEAKAQAEAFVKKIRDLSSPFNQLDGDIQTLETTLDDDSLDASQRLMAAETARDNIHQALDRLGKIVEDADKAATDDEKGDAGVSSLRKILDKSIQETATGQLDGIMRDRIQKVPKEFRDYVEKAIRKEMSEKGLDFAKILDSVKTSASTIVNSVRDGDERLEQQSRTLLNLQMSLIQSALKNADSLASGVSF